ncbi:MAG: hypothetical protein U0992_03180 [Planctomycetaceae bacterium]
MQSRRRQAIEFSEGTDLDRSEPRAGMLLRNSNRIFNRRYVDEIKTADDFMRLGIRSIGDMRFPVADADIDRRSGRLQWRGKEILPSGVDPVRQGDRFLHGPLMRRFADIVPVLFVVMTQ